MSTDTAATGVPLSELYRQPVVDAAGNTVGRLTDVIVALRGREHPPVTGLVVHTGDHDVFVPAQDIASLALADPDITLRGLSSRTSGEDDTTGTTTLQADLLIQGPATGHLDALVTRLSIESGVRTVSWQDQDPDTADAEERDDQQLPTGRRPIWRRSPPPSE